MQNGQKSGGSTTLLLWAIAVGTGVNGVSGVGSMGQLSSLETTLNEQIRQAEIRGELGRSIEANREMLALQLKQIDLMMPRDGILELHRAQQALIDKLIDWTGTVATKNELDLAIKKLQAQYGRSE